MHIKNQISHVNLPMYMLWPFGALRDKPEICSHSVDCVSGQLGHNRQLFVAALIRGVRRIRPETSDERCSLSRRARAEKTGEGFTARYQIVLHTPLDNII